MSELAGGKAFFNKKLVTDALERENQSTTRGTPGVQNRYKI
jgi:hypothetical protein